MAIDKGISLSAHGLFWVETAVGFIFAAVFINWLTGARVSPLRIVRIGTSASQAVLASVQPPSESPSSPRPIPVQPNYRFLVRNLTATTHRVLDSYFREAAAAYGAATSDLQPKTYIDLNTAAKAEIAAELQAYLDAQENLARQDQTAVEAEFRRLWDEEPKGRDVLALGLAQKHYQLLMKTGKLDREEVARDFRRVALG